MPLYEAKNPTFLRRFADFDRTSETAENAKIGLRRAFVSFHLDLAEKGTVSENVGFARFLIRTATVPFVSDCGGRDC